MYSAGLHFQLAPRQDKLRGDILLKGQTMSSRYKIAVYSVVNIKTGMTVLLHAYPYYFLLLPRPSFPRKWQ